MSDQDHPASGVCRAGEERSPKWTSVDYAEAVRQIAGTITCDCAGEIVLVVDDVDLYAFARLDLGGRSENLGVYVSSVDLSDTWPQNVSHELVAGRKALLALREVIDRELASEGGE